MKKGYREFQVVGRRLPSEKEPNPKIYRMRIFAKNEIRARSKFWYFMMRICDDKVKKSTGEILSCNEIFEKNPNKIKNFGIVLRYNYAGPQDHSNLYKEYRDTSRTGAVTQMYNDMAARYRARAEKIQIISIKTLKDSETTRASIQQFQKGSLKFPLPHRVLRAPASKFHTKFKATRPHTHF